MQSQKLSALQLELLNIYSFQPKEEDLVAIKQLLAKYFSGQFQKNIQKAIEKNNITEEDRCWRTRVACALSNYL